MEIYSFKLNCDGSTKLFKAPWCNYDAEEYPLIKNALEYKHHWIKFNDHLKDVML